MAPEESVTDPTMLPNTAWPNILLVGYAVASTTTAMSNTLIFLMICPFSFFPFTLACRDVGAGSPQHSLRRHEACPTGIPTIPGFETLKPTRVAKNCKLSDAPLRPDKRPEPSSRKE